MNNGVALSRRPRASSLAAHAAPTSTGAQVAGKRSMRRLTSANSIEYGATMMTATPRKSAKPTQRGLYGWRHDNVVNKLAVLRTMFGSRTTIKQNHPKTVPAWIYRQPVQLVPHNQPDIIVGSRAQRTVDFVEVTCCAESRVCF